MTSEATMHTLQRTSALRCMLGWAARSVIAGGAIAWGLATLASLRLLPEGTSTSSMRIDLADPPEYGPGWSVAVSERWFACVSTARAIVMPGAYGISGGGTLSLALVDQDPEPRFRDGSPGPRLPMLMPPGGGPADMSPEVARFIREGASRGGTLLVWPFERALGWPFPCMRYSIEGAGGWNRFAYWTVPPTRIVGGWELPRAPGAGLLEPRVMPFQPIWSGLALNACIYGSLLSMVVWTARSARRRRRRRAGRCEVCAHPLREASACPECGHAPSTLYKQRRPSPG